MSEREDQGIPVPLSLYQVVSAEHLRIISQASRGLSFKEDPNLPEGRFGYTNMQTGIIYINPAFLQSLRRRSIMGLLYHEAGHHAPESVEFQDRLFDSLGNPDIVPDAYKGSPEAAARFFESLSAHLHNGLADVWLESFMGRRPYYPVRESYEALYAEMGDRKFLAHLSKPEQLIQVLVVEDRYPHQRPIVELVDSDVYQAYERLKSNGAIAALRDREAFENYFASELDKKRTFERKFVAYEQAFLPEYLKLMEAELEERKKVRQQVKLGQAGAGAGYGSMDNAVPLTAEEEKELSNQLLDQLMQAGQEYASHAPSPEEQKQLQDKIRQIKDALEEKQRQMNEGQTPQRPKAEPIKKSGEESIRDLAEELQRQERERRTRDLAEELQRQERERRTRDLAESMKVRQESVESWNRIKEKYRREIDSTAAFLSEVFLDDRRKRLKYLCREGETVPGLEYETIAALISGELDPDTKMMTVRNPEFLETEIEFIVDTSGSMSGEPLDKSIDLLVIVTEAFKKVREDLAGEDLLLEDEQPFRVGVTTFSEAPQRVSKLEEPLSDQKELTIIDQTARVGGGTDEVEAIQEVYKGLTLGKDNIIKIIVVLSDGYGNKEGVAPIIRQLEEDDQVIFLAVGLGQNQEQADGVVATYLKPLKDQNKNVFGITTVEPSEALPKSLDFIKKQVEQRRQF